MVTARIVLPPDLAVSQRQVLTDSQVKYSLQPGAGPLKITGYRDRQYTSFLFPNTMGRSTELLEDCIRV